MASSNEIPSTMRAWTYSRNGRYRKVLSLNTSVPTPKPTEDEVLIKVAYSGLNPGDTKVMTLIPAWGTKIPALDYSGHIAARGPKAPENLKIGMPVFGVKDITAIYKGTGTLAEYTVVSPTKHMIAPIPEGHLSMEGAGGFGIAGMMAFDCIEVAKIPPDCGMRILINGASGGCGTAFVQAAKAMGAREIVATCSAPNFDLVKSLGADRVIDYREHKPLSSYLAQEYGDRPFDFIYDSVGAQELYANSPKYLKEDGLFLNIGAFTHGTFMTLWYWFSNMWWPKWLGGIPRQYIMFQGSCGPRASDWLVNFVKEGKIKPVIERAMGFDEALEAFDIVDSRRTRGRVVVKVADN